MKNALTAIAVTLTSLGAATTGALAQGAEGRIAVELPQAVIGVAQNDVLNMRAGPGVKHPVVNVLYPNDRGIFIRRCSNYVFWCQVELDNKVGWVNMRYLGGYAD